MKKIGTFFTSFFLALLSSIAVFFLLVNYCGRGVCEQPWFWDMYPLKKHFAAQKTSPKIVLIGGSSSLFGIHGERLRQYTGMDNINFSMSILIPMRFYLADLERTVGEGDVVVLPLELENHYCETEEKVFSNFGISLLFGCTPDVQKTLSWQELFSLYFQYGFSWIQQSLFQEQAPLCRMFRNQWARQGLFDGVYKEDYVLSEWTRRKSEHGHKLTGDYRDDLSCYGDWMIRQEGKAPETAAYALPTNVTREFLSNYERIKDLAEKRKATLLLVWPNIYYYAEQSGFADFKAMLENHGIIIHGRPEAVAFPKYFYHDPPHHMNLSGAELWTYELAKIICQATDRPVKTEKNWPYIVFAEQPSRYFPDAKNVQLYDTGVKIMQKKFRMVWNVPEGLRGKPLEANLIVTPEQAESGAVFTGIQLDKHGCFFTEKRHPEHAEIEVHVPGELTNHEQIAFSCSIAGKTIGMERVFFREDPFADEVAKTVFHVKEDAQYFAFKSGFAASEDWGRWTDGARAELSCYIPRRFRNQDLQMELELLTFVAEKKPVCRFAISSNGKVLTEVESRQFETKLKLRVPAELTGQPWLPLDILVDHPVSPKVLGISEDTRQLGIGIKSISFKSDL